MAELRLSARKLVPFCTYRRRSSFLTVVRSRSVLGQAHTPRRRLTSFAVLALTVLIVPAVSGANPSHSTASLRAHDAAIAEKSRAAVLGLYSLDQQYAAAQARVASLHRAAVSLRQQRAILRHQLTVARRGLRISQQRLAVRLRTLYEQGNVEPIDIVLGASNLDEALTNLDNLQRVSGQGQDVLREFKSARTATIDLERGLARRETALAAETRAAEAAAASLSRTLAARHAYISSLATERRLTEQRISALVAEAHAALVKSATLASPALQPGYSAAASAPVSTSGQTITVSATGYSLPGHTASGLAVGWGVVAVDPSIIPLGTHMTIPGYGEAVAADTGGAVVGSTIDLWFPTVAQANAWGRRVVTIVVH
jgi:3D (Asp-Asp-Asp) domain-containing protein/cell division protein FtsB